MRKVRELGLQNTHQLGSEPAAKYNYFTGGPAVLQVFISVASKVAATRTQ